MNSFFFTLALTLFILTSCNSFGNLTFKGDLPNSLSEISAAEICTNSNIIWTIEDSGNSTNLYGINEEGKILKQVQIENSKNTDWEDLTSDSNCNIYIGDFGNNSKKRNNFKILKIQNDFLNNNSVEAQIIRFKLPKKTKSKDFEAFFLFKNHFYLISKEHKEFSVFKVPNDLGIHTAKLVSKYNFEGKNNKVTSADISEDGKTIVLLNHDKIWKLSDFKKDDFFSGKITETPFEHISQKEGIAFKNNSDVIITDERNGSVGGNIYSFKID